MWPRTFDTGPKPIDFYNRFGGTTALLASQHMFVELVDALTENNSPLSRKNGLFRLGFSGFVLAVVGAVIVALAS